MSQFTFERKLSLAIAAIVLATSLSAQIPMPPPAKPVTRYHAAVVPKQASQLIARTVLPVVNPPVIWVCVVLAATNEIQFCTNLLQDSWTDVLVTNNLTTACMAIPAPGAVGFIRNKITWAANPIGCLVSTNAPTPP